MSLHRQPDGTPFPTEVGAKRSGGKRGWVDGTWNVIPDPTGAGYCIEVNDAAQTEAAPTSAPTPQVVAPQGVSPETPAETRTRGRTETYYWVRFHNRQNTSEQADVHLSVNGEPVVCQRGVKVALPERYLEVARHGTYPVFRQMPGETRKQVGEVMFFPFDVLGEATRADFENQFKAGTEATRKALAAEEAAAAAAQVAAQR